MKKRITVWNILALVFIFYVIMNIVVLRSKSRRSEAMTHKYFVHNLRRINQAVVLYTQEYQGKMPTASIWADLIKKQQLVFESDFITPMSYSNSGLYYNRSLEDKLAVNLKGCTVVIFTGRGPWNANGNMIDFRNSSVNRKYSYVITLNGNVYRYIADNNSYQRLKDGRVFSFDTLHWE